jgi:hypothetical protein
MRAVAAFLLFLSPSLLLAQPSPPRFMFIYRDSLKRGADSAFNAIENEAAQICADLRCPNPYLGLESLTGPREAWWINTFATEADTTRVVKAYAANRPLSEALEGITRRKRALVGTPIQHYAVYRPELSRGPGWRVAGARFMVVTVRRDRMPAEGSVWESADSTLYVFRSVRTRAEADSLARASGARIFGVRATWSMPAAEWVAADPGFWRLAPSPKARR